MKRFKNILFVAQGIAGKSSSLKIAAALADKNKARLTVVEVIKDLSAYMNILPASSHSLDLEYEIIQEHSERLDHIIAPFLNKGINISRKILKGTPFLEIIRQVIKKEHDLVVITPQGHSGFSEMLFGTTTMHLMRKCPCPVWAIKPGQPERFSRILAAVDFDPSNRDNDALNVSIMEMALSLSRMHKSELHLIHAFNFDLEGMRMPGLSVDEMSGEMKKTNRKWFDELAKKYISEASHHQAHFLEGEAASVIPKFAEESRIDLIVMGTIARTGIAGLFIGSTAEKLLHRINCSVLAIKPSGYISPVIVD